jgi:ribosomal protein S18 acetylase RimI-like enzyme
MTDAQFAAYRSTAEDGYARQVAESGAMSWAAAVEKAAADFARLLPEGRGTPGAHLFTAHAGDDQVGMVWLRLETGADGRHAFVYDIEVRPEHRRAGHGRAIMLAAEDFVRAQGAESIGLNVFGQNVGARALYEDLGYETISIQMRKRLR